MSVYHQMGHDSENLLSAKHLENYKGAILSPVNYDRDHIIEQVKASTTRSDSEMIFDPQLYVPNSERGYLRNWSYFPVDVDTADLSSIEWWYRFLEALAAECLTLGPLNVCSPAVLPRSYTDEYFQTLVVLASLLQERLEGTGLSTIQTAVVGLADLAQPNRSMQISSILSRTKTQRIYLILVGDTEPRRELSDVEEIKGAMQLVNMLAQAGLRVLVAYCSSDMLLWRYAGAADCATGKFFNLRRFTRSRFDEPTSGGGQLPYWFEERLLAFLRDSDRVRIQKAGLFSNSSDRNPWAQDILTLLSENPAAPWLALSWRHYLWWFADAEARITDGTLDVPRALKESESIWKAIEDKILMEETRNDGSWLRAWRRACIESIP